MSDSIEQIIHLKDTIIEKINKGQNLESQLSELDSNFFTQKNECLTKYKTDIESYENQLTQKLDQDNDRLENEYTQRYKVLEQNKQQALLELDDYIKKQESTFLENNQYAFQPLRDTLALKNKIGSLIDTMGVKGNYSEMKCPKLDTIKDVIAFNKKLVKLPELQGISDLTVHNYMHHTGIILRLVNKLVDYFGYEKRAIVEIGAIICSGYLLAMYSIYLLPCIAIPLAGLGYMRYRSYATMERLCGTYYQAINNYEEIERVISNLLLRVQNTEFESQKENMTQKIEDRFNEDVENLGEFELNELDENLLLDYTSSKKQETDRIINTLDKTYKQTQEDLTKEYEINELEIQDLKTELSNLNHQFVSALEVFDDNCDLPQQIHYGFVKDSTYDLDYPCFEANIKMSMAIIHDLQSREAVINFIKYYILQNWVSTNPTLVQYHIFDDKEFATELAEVNLGEDKLFKTYTQSSEITECISYLINEIQTRNVTILRKVNSLTEYNQKLFSEGANLLQYQIVINLNPNRELLKNPRYISLIQQASNCGIIIINLIPSDYLQQSGSQNDTMILLENTYKHEKVLNFKEGTISEGLTIEQGSTFTGVELSKQKYIERSDAVINRYNAYKPSALLYLEHKNKNFPTLWNKKVGNGIDIQVGNLNGEGDKPFVLTLGNKNPHALLAGLSGKGKSVFLNNAILSIAEQYSPEQVNFFMLDFKGTELLTYAIPKSLPHCRVVSATRDVAYVLSIFDNLIEEMEARNQMFLILGVRQFVTYCELDPKEVMKKLSDKTNKDLQTLLSTPKGKRLIEGMLKNGLYPVLPEIVFIIDEFADMFLINDDLSSDVKDRIRRLAKVGRSAGVHMVFASQNMDGTVPEDALDQFTLRICVPSSPNVSKSLLGSESASRINIGYAISNDNYAEGEKNDFFFRVPYSSDDVVLERVSYLNEKGKQLGFEEPVLVYNENETFEYDTFKGHLKAYPKLHKSNSYILGEATIYTGNNYPTLYGMQFADRENALFCSKFTTRLNTLTAQFLDSLARKQIDYYFYTSDKSFASVYSEEYLKNQPNPCKGYILESSSLPLFKQLGKELLERKYLLGAPKTTKFGTTKQLPPEEQLKFEDLKPTYYILHGLQSTYGIGLDGSSDDDNLLELLNSSIVEINKHKMYFIFATTKLQPLFRVSNDCIHFVISGLTERDEGYVPDLVGKLLRNANPNFGCYVNSNTQQAKRFKVYELFKETFEDDTVLFS